MNISGAAAADNWFQSGYKAISELLDNKNAPKRKFVPVRLKNDGRPFFLHRFPSERSAVSARLYPPIRSVEILRGCIGDWCHVRIGSAFGWLKKDRLELRIPDNGRTNNPPRKPKRYVAPLEKDVEPPVRTAALPQENIALPKQKAALAEEEIEPVEVVNIPLPVRKSPAPRPRKLAQVKPDPAPAPKTETPDKEIVKSNESTKSNKRAIKNIDAVKQEQSTVTTVLNLPGISLTEQQSEEPERYVTPRQKDIGPPPPAPNAPPPQQEIAPVEVANIPLPVQKEPAPTPAPEKLAQVQQNPVAPPKTETRDQDQEPVTNTVSTTLNRKVIENIGAVKRQESPVVTTLKLSEIKKEKYSLTAVGDATFLPVREDHAENARILGGIPFFADDVEALGLCIDEWCLVKWGDLRGWIERRHLSETSEIETPLLQLKSAVGTSRIPVFKKPDEKADIASYLMHPATSIAPIGKCNQEWCNIRYSDATGWVRSKNLTRQ